jgi:tetratricopeptide (TPR) repeat protein
VFVRAVAVARDHERADAVVGFARALWPLQLKGGRWDEVLPALRIAAGYADAGHLDPRAAGALHFQLSHCLGQLGGWDEADAAAHAAVAAERAAGHRRGEASAVEQLGLLCLYRQHPGEALAHFAEAERLYGLIGPDDEGAADLPRARALIERHKGRALFGLGRHEEARERLERARDFFAAQGEGYNEARALTDLAETLHLAGEDDAALVRIEDAVRLLIPQQAAPHLHYLAVMRQRCEAALRR